VEKQRTGKRIKVWYERDFPAEHKDGMIAQLRQVFVDRLRLAWEVADQGIVTPCHQLLIDQSKINGQVILDGLLRPELGEGSPCAPITFFSPGNYLTTSGQVGKEEMGVVFFSSDISVRGNTDYMLGCAGNQLSVSLFHFGRSLSPVITMALTWLIIHELGHEFLKDHPSDRALDWRIPDHVRQAIERRVFCDRSGMHCMQNGCVMNQLDEGNPKVQLYTRLPPKNPDWFCPSCLEFLSAKGLCNTK